MAAVSEDAIKQWWTEKLQAERKSSSKKRKRVSSEMVAKGRTLARKWNFKKECMVGRVEVKAGTIVWCDEDGAIWTSLKDFVAKRNHGRRMGWKAKREGKSDTLGGRQFDHDVFPTKGVTGYGSIQTNQANRGLGNAVNCLRLDKGVSKTLWKQIGAALKAIPYQVRTRKRTQTVLLKAFEKALKVALVLRRRRTRTNPTCTLETPSGSAVIPGFTLCRGRAATSRGPTLFSTSDASEHTTGNTLIEPPSASV